MTAKGKPSIAGQNTSEEAGVLPVTLHMSPSRPALRWVFRWENDDLIEEEDDSIDEEDEEEDENSEGENISCDSIEMFVVTVSHVQDLDYQETPKNLQDHFHSCPHQVVYN